MFTIGDFLAGTLAWAPTGHFSTLDWTLQKPRLDPLVDPRLNPSPDLVWTAVYPLADLLVISGHLSHKSTAGVWCSQDCRRTMPDTGVQAVAGRMQMMPAVQRGRLRHLNYTEGFAHPGGESGLASSPSATVFPAVNQTLPRHFLHLPGGLLLQFSSQNASSVQTHRCLPAGPTGFTAFQSRLPSRPNDAHPRFV